MWKIEIFTGMVVIIIYGQKSKHKIYTTALSQYSKSVNILQYTGCISKYFQTYQEDCATCLQQTVGWQWLWSLQDWPNRAGCWLLHVSQESSMEILGPWWHPAELGLWTSMDSAGGDTVEWAQQDPNHREKERQRDKRKERTGQEKENPIKQAITNSSCKWKPMHSFLIGLWKLAFQGTPRCRLLTVYRT